MVVVVRYKKKEMRKTIRVILIFIVILVIYTKLDKTPSKENVSQSLLDWKSQEQIFEYQGNKLSYHDSGDSSKEVIVLLHGYPTSSYDWHSIWSGLSGNYRLIAMDMLGFGFSDKPADIEYTIAMQTDILEAFLKSIQVENIHLVAHDYGDNVAQELLARNIEQKEAYPLNIASLTLLNGGLFPETHRPTIIQSLLSSPIGGIVASFTNETLFEKSFSKVFGPNTQPNKQDLIDQWYVICHQKGYEIADKLTHAADDREKNRERWVGALVAPNVPILYISGLLDPVTGRETVERYLELVPYPNVVKLDSVGHFPQLEAPKEVIIKVNAHIEKTKGFENSDENAETQDTVNSQ